MTQDRTFIETQFPVSKLSKESYKERKANYSQTLTGLGKWWGRKPLVMVRAVILGLLLPTSNNPKKDREIFLKLMTMDEDGLWRRKRKSIPAADLYARLVISERQKYFVSENGKEKFKKGVTREEKEALQRRVFNALSYNEKLEYCDRPEQIDGPSPEAWAEINAYLGTHANSLQELVEELGERRFEHVPRVGDAFCGGGSVPFEAARIGCEAYGSDLNPVAALLTWGALNIVGGGPDIAKQVADTQRAVYYDAVDRQITEWGIEHNEQGWHADAYLYCTETKCLECGLVVPLAPSWVIGEKTRTIANLRPQPRAKRFEIEIISGVSSKELAEVKTGTARDSELHCPHCHTVTPISTIRGDHREENGNTNQLRLWQKDDVVPHPDDIFQERLYCIRWVETYDDEEGELATRRHYRAPTKQDLKREQKVLELLQERFHEWQEKGYIPSLPIEPGEKTDEPIRTRGWTHWHHLFNPRQLIVHGQLSRMTQQISKNLPTHLIGLLCVGRCANWNSKLSRWLSDSANEKGADTFSNQALNMLYNYSVRTLHSLDTAWFPRTRHNECNRSYANVKDSRAVGFMASIWITDPPYADAVNYDELSEFFLAWYEKHIKKLFPDWYTDSKRALAVRGDDESFRRSMVDCYKNLVRHMPDNGMQVVMFTHQDASVWADLALILWASGLRVTAAWTIATETESALKKGNYVQGTVLLVLRKQTSEEVGFLDEITADIRPEVERQLETMLALDDKEDPNFSDSDYQLAAYAAALRVLTQYKSIEDFDIETELAKPRVRGEKSPIEQVIENAVKIASNYLIPKALHDEDMTRRDIWRKLSAEEKFYLKGLEAESHGEFRHGVYQEFARGFGLKEYTFMLENGKANAAKLKTACEFKRRELGTPGFGSSLTRHILFSVSKVCETGNVKDGMKWLKEEIDGDYWAQRQTIASLLRYLSKLPIEHWRKDAEAARLLTGTVENDRV
jgi:Adenine-specific DNA methylase containing a Zn-ribbon